MPYQLINAPIAWRSFGTKSAERELPWLLITPNIKATDQDISDLTFQLLVDGWQSITIGDTHPIKTWTVRLAGGGVHLRQHGGEPHNTSQNNADWRALIIKHGALWLAFNPAIRLDPITADDLDIGHYAAHHAVLTARVLLEPR